MSRSRASAACPVVVALALAVPLGSQAATARTAGYVAQSASAQALISSLAILRRSQTTTDVLPADLQPARRSGTIIPSLSRLVATLPGAELFLVVTTPARGSPPLWSPRLGDQVAIVTVTAQGNAESQAIPAADLTNGDELMYAGGVRHPGHKLGAAYNVAIVPDGVARVRWTFVRWTSGNGAWKAGRVADAPVINNVAVVPLVPSTAVLLRATWYAPDGSVVPTSDRALRRAIAAQDAVLSARAARYDARHSYRAAPALLADFAVFAVTSRSGVRTAAGNIISRPRLSSVPYAILDIAAPNEPPQLDPEDMRQVTTRSGFRLWVIPGRRGICVAALDRSRLPDGLGSAASEACTANLLDAESHGTGFSSGAGGFSITCRVLPKTIPTITIRTAGGIRKTIHPPDGVYVRLGAAAYTGNQSATDAGSSSTML